MSRPTSPTPSRARRPLSVLIAIAAIVVVAGAGGLAWLFGGGAPAAPTIEGGTAATATPAPSSAAASVLPASSAGTAAAIDGTWTLDPSVGTFADFSGSWAGYRVKEELANIGATEAVGRTPELTASIVVEGGAIVSGAITVDLTSLVSDRPMRDGRVQDALGVGTYPSAELAIDGPVTIPAGLEAGETVTLQVPATLTLHGVSAPVVVPVSARLADGVVQVVGKLPVTLTGFGITPPSSFMVLSVADDAAIELQLFLRKG